MTTIKILAEKLGLDISTVSRGLRDDPRVKNETREKIKKAALKFNYKPNLAARSLVQKKTFTIMCLLPVLNDPVEIKLPELISRYLYKIDYDLLIALHHNDNSIFERQLMRLEQGVADGIFILPDYNNKTDSVLSKIKNKNYPLVLLDRPSNKNNLPLITSDNYSAVDELVSKNKKAGTDLVIPLFNKLRRNVVEEERLVGTLNSVKKLNIETCNDMRKVNSKISICKTISILASTQDEVLSFILKYKTEIKNKKIFVSVFDKWKGNEEKADIIFVCHQDFNSIALSAVELMNELLKEIPQKNIVKKIPCLKIKTLK